MSGSPFLQARSPTDAPARIRGVRAGVIDVGSNTVRLLVAVTRDGAVTPLREERTYLGLGAEILRQGGLSEAILAETAAVTRHYAQLARKLEAVAVEVIVTAPGRQAANADELIHRLARAAQAPVRVLSAQEEGLLSYEGATAALAGSLPPTVAVVDVGGGSTELVVGAPPHPPSWCRTVDLGSLRLAAEFLHADPPTSAEMAAAEEETRRRLAGLVPPRPHAALATGGSARNLAKVVGPPLGEPELTEAIELASGRRSTKLAKAYRLDERRARILPAGAIILREVTRKLGVPLQPARGGLREGAVSALLAELRAA